jgi:hypothetical protein
MARKPSAGGARRRDSGYEPRARAETRVSASTSISEGRSPASLRHPRSDTLVPRRPPQEGATPVPRHARPPPASPTRVNRGRQTTTGGVFSGEGRKSAPSKARTRGRPTCCAEDGQPNQQSLGEVTAGGDRAGRGQIPQELLQDEKVAMTHETIYPEDLEPLGISKYEDDEYRPRGSRAEGCVWCELWSPRRLRVFVLSCVWCGFCCPRRIRVFVGYQRELVTSSKLVAGLIKSR